MGLGVRTDTKEHMPDELAELFIVKSWVRPLLVILCTLHIG